MKTIEIKTFELNDIIKRALTLEADHEDDFLINCNGGPWCPRCRAAQAKGQLADELELPFDWGDDLLQILAYRLPRGILTREQADKALVDLVE